MEFSYIQTRPVLSSSVRFGSWRARCVQFSVVVDRRRHTGLRPCPSVPDKAMTCRSRRRRSVSPTFPRLDRATGSQDSSENPSAGESSTVGLLLLFFTYLRAQSRASRRAGRRRRRARVQIAVATLSCNSLRQTAHTDPASVHQAAKLVAALIRVAGVTASLAESNGSKPGL